MLKKMTVLIAAAGVVVSMAAAQDLDGLMKLKPGRSRAVTSTDPSFTGNADRIQRSEVRILSGTPRFPPIWPVKSSV
jgi:hypothetical protein